ncbi:MAG: DEAD/DEAH box helicase family protein [Colwellia sp.]|nr:DEAD/DEAH box helicase family protein [Colwellia sp.]
MNLYDFIPIYPDVESDNFYQEIRDKKELFDDRLEKTEDIPHNSPGTYMNHQKITYKYISSLTNYNNVLLAWEMGTGKTCGAISICENIFKQNMGINSAIYLAKGKGLTRKFKKSLALDCTFGKKYYNEKYQEFEISSKAPILNTLGKSRYSTFTFGPFIQDIAQSTDEQIKEKYSNRVFIIDEIHNIKIGKRKNEQQQNYNKYHHFLHTVENCKIILLSGTPMYDSPEEIASVMNLILPLNKQLPTGKDFLAEYMRNGEGKRYRLQENKIDKLKGYFKGYVSYLTNMDSGYDVEYITESHVEHQPIDGQKVGTIIDYSKTPEWRDPQTNISPLQYIKIFPSYFHPQQLRAYQNALQQSIEEEHIQTKEDDVEFGEETETINNKTKLYKTFQANLFVFPDGTYGKEGYERNITNSGTATPAFLDQIGTLENLKNYSVKYYELIKQVLSVSQDTENPRKVFIYCFYISGSGLNLLGKLLNYFGGYTQTQTGVVNTETKRYSIISTETANTAAIANTIIDRFNNPDNVTGKYIQVIMGTSMIAEGYDLYDTDVCHVLTPWWNYSNISQIIGRILRMGRHENLKNQQELEGGNRKINVKIYQHVTMNHAYKRDETTNPNRYNRGSRILEFSTDMHMYNTAEMKDLSIHSILHVMKKAAYDCSLTYERNERTNKQDGSRDCDYTTCKYTCDGFDPAIPMEDYSGGTDESTWELYYENLNEITNKIRKIFSVRFAVPLAEIFEIFNVGETENTFNIIGVLIKLVSNNTPILNKYGRISYLKEENDLLYLVDHFTIKSNSLDVYYIENPVIKLNNNIDTILSNNIKEFIEDWMTIICNTQSKDVRYQHIDYLFVNQQEYLFEIVYNLLITNLGKTTNPTKNHVIMEILNYFSSKIIVTVMGDDGTPLQIEGNFDNPQSHIEIISFIKNESKDILRCYNYDTNEWYTCTSAKISDVQHFKENILINLINRATIAEINYYGVDSDGVFAIRDYLINVLI